MSVLTPRNFGLCAALIEISFREKFAVEKHLRAFEVAFCQLKVGARVGNLRHLVDRELRAVGKPEPADDLRSVGVGFGDLRFHFGRRDSNQRIALANTGASLDRRRDDAALYFCGHFSLFLSGKRAGHLEEAPNRLLDCGRATDGDRWRRRTRVR